jgi:hypothetical protein
MKRLIGTWLLTSLAVTMFAKSPEHGRLKIEVHVYNYSALSAQELALAEQETVRIYGRLGVEMEWRSCLHAAEQLDHNASCDQPGAPTTFILRLLSDEMAQRFRLGSDIYGIAAVPANGGFGVVANVFADRASGMSTDKGSQTVILGNLIAHELGHLLLGEVRHSAGAGIMHVPWQTKELEQIKRGVMLFLPGQTERIRAQVFARTVGSSDLLAPHR